MEMALNLLLAGVVIVFFVLVLLIFIIKIYSAIVQAAQNGNQKRKDAKKAAEKKPEPVKAEPQASTIQTTTDNGAIPGEVIAVIAAAVDAMYDKPVKIKSVRRSRSNSGSSWRNAGLFENTKPF
ncbi:MAG: OadG family transporter subunit [Candidatus Pseudoruminococcus sp.]|uniref:OadG family transporter subunit n=1 Tax=Candidatus Pseudoruminococcus sp. TaxID=3101048 RepID=UPI002A7E02E4|nr:OadG family protein [Ruminococcus sp.]MDY2783805.1 OadG family transporter subunit [Candidatus Pseudoruminococcus sp.]